MEVRSEAAVLSCCDGRLPVPRVIQQREGVLIMSELVAVNLIEVSLQEAINVLVKALKRIHVINSSMPVHYHVRETSTVANKAIAQVCAFSSPFCVAMSETAILQQLTGLSTVGGIFSPRGPNHLAKAEP